MNAMEPKILAKTFPWKKKFLCYDTTTNRIFTVDRVFRDVLSIYDYFNTGEVYERLVEKHPRAAIGQAVESIKNIHLETGGLALGGDRQFRFPIDPARYKELLEKRIRHIVIGLTQHCNFRCSYCRESERQNSGNKSKTKPWEILRQAVDFLASHSGDFVKESGKPLRVDFYGGEPLLETALMFRAVDHLRQTYPEIHAKTTFSVTTNGSQMSETLIKRLIREDFMLYVSLDGSREINDRYRRRADGSGSFDLVTGNLERIGRIDPDFLEKNVAFSIVFAPPYRLKESLDFFRSRFPRQFARSSLLELDPEQTALFSRRNQDKDDKELIRQERLLRRELISSRDRAWADSCLGRMFGQRMESFHFRPMKRIPEVLFPNRICIPGLKKVYIDIYGDLHACERMPASKSIGRLKSGFDLDRIYALIGDYIALMEDCASCWAVRFCGECYIGSIEKGEFSRSKRKRSCRKRRRAVLEDMKGSLNLSYADPRSFDSKRAMP